MSIRFEISSPLSKIHHLKYSSPVVANGYQQKLNASIGEDKDYVTA